MNEFDCSMGSELSTLNNILIECMSFRGPESSSQVQKGSNVKIVMEQARQRQIRKSFTLQTRPVRLASAPTNREQFEVSRANTAEIYYSPKTAELLSRLVLIMNILLVFLVAVVRAESPRNL